MHPILYLSEWLHQRNKVVQNFFQGISHGTDVTKTVVAKLTRCMENVYAINNKYYVSPFAFSNNLMAYFATGSKSVTTLNSASTPSGCYTTLSSWIKDHAKEKITCPSDHDVVTFFDNNQVKNFKFYILYLS